METVRGVGYRLVESPDAPAARAARPAPRSRTSSSRRAALGTVVVAVSAWSGPATSPRRWATARATRWARRWTRRPRRPSTTRSATRCSRRGGHRRRWQPIVVSLALASAASRGPVARWRAAARRIAGGHYAERVPPIGPGEIGRAGGVLQRDGGLARGDRAAAARARRRRRARAAHAAHHRSTGTSRGSRTASCSRPRDLAPAARGDGPPHAPGQRPLGAVARRGAAAAAHHRGRRRRGARARGRRRASCPGGRARGIRSLEAAGRLIVRADRERLAADPRQLPLQRPPLQPDGHPVTGSSAADASMRGRAWSVATRGRD